MHLRCPPITFVAGLLSSISGSISSCISSKGGRKRRRTGNRHGKTMRKKRGGCSIACRCVCIIGRPHWVGTTRPSFFTSNRSLILFLPPSLLSSHRFSAPNKMPPGSVTSWHAPITAITTVVFFVRERKTPPHPLFLPSLPPSRLHLPSSTTEKLSTHGQLTTFCLTRTRKKRRKRGSKRRDDVKANGSQNRRREGGREGQRQTKQPSRSVQQRILFPPPRTHTALPPFKTPRAGSP